MVLNFFKPIWGFITIELRFIISSSTVACVALSSKILSLLDDEEGDKDDDMGDEPTCTDDKFRAGFAKVRIK